MRRPSTSTRPASTGTLAAVLATGLAFFAACDSLPGKPNEADRPITPGEVQDFAVLFGENCSGCHGADGRSGAATPLNDAVFLAIANDDVIRKVTASGVRGTAMPAFARSSGGMLTDAQVEILVREMRARWSRPAELAGVTPPPYSLATDGGAPGDAGRGAAAFATYCGSCHGPTGTGGPKGGSVVDPSYLALVSDQALRTIVIAGRPDLGMPDWRGGPNGQPMSAQDVSDVVAWLASQRKPFPGGGVARDD